MLPSWLLVSLYVTVGVVALALAFFRPAWIPILLVLVMPTGDFSFQWGVTWDLPKVVILIFLLSLPAHFAVRSRFTTRLKIPGTVAIFLLIVALSTLASYLRLSAGSSSGYSALRGPLLRPEVQFISLLLRVAILVAVVAVVRGQDSVIKLLKGVLFISTLLAAYGLYQFIGYYTGLPILTIYRAQSSLSHGYGIFTTGGLSIFRVGSFAGEPKYAAKFLLPSILLLTSARIFPLPELRGWCSSYPVLALHWVVFVLTFATSSFYAIILTIPFVMALVLIYPGRIKLRGTASIALVIGLCMGGLIAFAGPKLATEVAQARVTGRAGPVAGPEKAAIEFLKHNPDYLLSGIGLGNASFYLRPFFSVSYDGRPLTIALHSSYLSLLLEGGVLTLLAFLMFLGAWLMHGIRLLTRNKGTEFSPLLAATIIVCIGVGILNSFTPTEATGQIWLYWGILIALCTSAKTGARIKKVCRAHSGAAVNSEPTLAQYA